MSLVAFKILDVIAFTPADDESLMVSMTDEMPALLLLEVGVCLGD